MPVDLDAAFVERFGRVPSAQEHQLLEEGLALARRVAGTSLVEVTDTLVMTGSGDRALVLPDKPVAEVTEVRVSGVVVDPSLYDPERRTGVLRRYSGCWPNDRVDNVEVDWTHGPPSLPLEVQGMILEAAKRAAQSTPAAEVQSETWGQHTLAFRAETNSSIGFRLLEEQRIASYGVNAIVIGRDPLAGGRG